MSGGHQPPSPSLVSPALVKNKNIVSMIWLELVFNEANVGSSLVDSLKPEDSWQKS
jgi:hypothetical protein